MLDDLRGRVAGERARQRLADEAAGPEDDHLGAHRAAHRVRIASTASVQAADVRVGRRAATVGALDQDGPAAGRPARLDVAGPVADP